MKYLLILLVLTTGVLLLPYKKLGAVKKVLCALTVAFAAAFAVQALLPQVFVPKATTPVTITAKGETVSPAEGCEIWIKSVKVDGKTYSPREIFANGWIEKDGLLGWRNYDAPTDLSNSIQGELPAGKDRSIIFQANKWRGNAAVSINGSETAVNCYAAGEQNGETAYQAPAETSPARSVITPQIQMAMFLGVMLLAFIVILLLFKIDRKRHGTTGKAVSNAGKKREVWADLLRVVCIFTVVLLHCTCGMYDNFTNRDTWYHYLYINSFTAFAVPAFFMLSGAFLIGKKESIRVVLGKRVVKLFIPLAVWSFVYILVNKYYWKQDISLIRSILNIPFTSQYSHLWFMYPLLGLYFLLPIISFLYYNLSQSLKRYLLVLVCAVPCVLGTLAAAASANLSQPWFTLGFPEIGLFILGKIIADNREKLYGKWKIPAVCVFAGFSTVVLSSYYMTLKSGAPSKVFISAYGYLPVFFFAVSMFALFYSLEPKWAAVSEKGKWIITKLSNLSMGVYFVHMLALVFVGNHYLGPIGFTSNAGGIWNMFLGAVVYFTISAMFCNVLSHIPYLWCLGAAKQTIIEETETEESRDGLQEKKVNALQLYTNRSRSAGIDGMRGLIAVIIALFHFERIFPFQKQIFATGYLGVEFFFIVSGFLLAQHLLTKDKSEINVKAAMKKRIFRLYPVYFIGILLISILHSLKWYHGNIFAWLASSKTLGMEIGTELLCLQMTGVSNFAIVNYPDWYVSVLLIITFLMIICYKLGGKIFIHFLIPVSAIGAYFVLVRKYGLLDLNAGFTKGICTGLIRGWAGMALGIVLYEVFIYLKERLQKMDFVVISILEFVFAGWFFGQMILQHPSKTDYLVLIPISGLVLIMFSTGGLLSKFLTWKPFALLGKISYSFYISQSFCAIFLNYWMKDLTQPAVTAVYLLFNILIAGLLYYFIECNLQNHIKLKKESGAV